MRAFLHDFYGGPAVKWYRILAEVTAVPAAVVVVFSGIDRIGGPHWLTLTGAVTCASIYPAARAYFVWKRANSPAVGAVRPEWASKYGPGSAPVLTLSEMQRYGHEILKHLGECASDDDLREVADWLRELQVFTLKNCPQSCTVFTAGSIERIGQCEVDDDVERSTRARQAMEWALGQVKHTLWQMGADL